MQTLQSYLKSHAIRQEDFAGQIGSTQATVSRLANGTSRPSLDLAVAIERATGGSVPATSWVPDVAPPQTQPPTEDAA